MSLFEEDPSFIQRLRRFHCNESGATLTEFIITLPIWVIMMGGLINLGKLGKDTTANQMETQTKLWNSVMAASTGENEDYMFPAAAGAAAAAESGSLAGQSANPHQVASAANAVVMSTGLAANGSWGESYERALPLSVIPGADVPDLHYQVDDILETGSSYPNKAVNDGVVSTDWKSGGSGSLSSKIASYAGSALSGSGAVAAIGAGSRYGEVYSETVDQEIELIFGAKVTANSHANLLVAPSPRTGKDARFTPFILARLLAEGEENYAVMMNFGESEWENSSGESRDTPGDPEDEINDEKESEEEELEEKKERCGEDDPPDYCDTFCADIDGGC